MVQSRILLVDDDASKRYTTAHLLRREGYDVTEAATGYQALELVGDRPDLVILDVNLPDLDGYEVARRIKSAPETALLPVLHLSATFVREEHRVRGLESGADGYLTYPFEKLVLLAQVRAFLRLRVSERERNDSFSKEREARARAEYLQGRFELLANVSEAMASSLDARVLLEALSDQLVPALADFGLFVVFDRARRIELVVARHADTAAQAELESLAVGAERLVLSKRGIGRVLETRGADFAAVVDATTLSELGPDAESAMLWQRIRPLSFLAAPLMSGGELRGAMMLGTSETRGRVLTLDDVRLSEDIARRAASALENAKLFAETLRDRERVEEANRAKDEFLATVSHELRTPLSAILGWSQLLRSGRLTDEKRLRAMETIERNARSQTQLIDDLLDISRIITGKMRLTVRPVEPGRIVDAVVESCRPSATAKDIRLVCTVDPNAGVVSADPDRLQQVVWNLVSNAIKFTPRGGTVSIALTGMGDHIDISVVDTGQGIDPAFLPHVFERFRQAEGSATRRHGGMGLGLAIVRHLVELHGGSVSADSEGSDRGSRFSVRLPVANVPQAAVPRVPSNVRDGAALDFDVPEDIVGMRVLIVEDEKDTRELLRFVLEQCRIDVTAVASAEEAMVEFERAPPNLLVCDIAMPGEDGYSLMTRIRALPEEKGGRVPALALTAYARSEDRTRALISGFHMHVAKPVVPAEVVACVVTLSGHRWK